MDNSKKNRDLEILRNLLKSDEFSSLNDELKDIILKTFEGATSKSKQDFGFMEKLFGKQADNIALYISFIVTVLLIVVGLIYILLPLEYKQTTNLDFWQAIGPIITGALGYIFGANVKK